METVRNKNWADYVRGIIGWDCTSTERASRRSTIRLDHLERIADGEGPGEYAEELQSIGIDPVVWDRLTNGADRGSYKCCYTILGEERVAA